MFSGTARQTTFSALLLLAANTELASQDDETSAETPRFFYLGGLYATII